MIQIVPISQTAPLFEKGSTSSAEGEGLSGLPFADILRESMDQMMETQKVSNQDAYDLAMGNTDDIASVMIHSAQATAAMEMTVQLASRAVSAYKEILQMQI